MLTRVSYEAQCLRQCVRSISKTPKVTLPDYTTSVNTAAHKLNRPTDEKLRKQFNALNMSKQSNQLTRTSLIPETLLEMERNEEFKITLENLNKYGQEKLTREEMRARHRALDKLGFLDFQSFCAGKVPDTGILKKTAVDTLQINVGLYCNQACSHCHVESSPKRSEMMSREVADRCLALLYSSPKTKTLDVTGGAPELCDQFRHIVSGAVGMGRRVIDRCNLTVLTEPGQEGLGDFLKEHRVEIAASLPCYSRRNVNLQRGKGVFQRSIEGLKLLNELGYGEPGTGLILNLVYNPLGAFLPPEQVALEKKYKEELKEDFGISFNSLFTITNMPIKRFCDFLVRRGELTEYMDLLVRNFNPGTLDQVMCTNLVSVNYDGTLYDCDFNQQLDLPLHINSSTASQGDTPFDTTVTHSDTTSRLTKTRWTVFEIDSLDALCGSPVRTSSHCFGCTAGMGSS